MTDGITPHERQELRSVVKGQFKVLRSEVKRRQEEMRAEIEMDLLDRYRDEDNAIAAAQEEVAQIVREALRQIEAVGRELKLGYSDLTVKTGQTYRGIGLEASNHNKTQLHSAALAAIPNTVGNANLALDRQEVDLLRQLSEGALEGENARSFLASIPSVGELVPRARLKELESGL